jgi:DNA topoisomerase-6 subunit B
VDEYLEQTAIANPHATLHYKDPEGGLRTYRRSTKELPREPKEIKPHPYGVELGRLVTMLKDSNAATLAQFLCSSFSRVSSSVAREICTKAGLSPRASAKRIGRREADSLYHAIQETKIKAPATDCISPIGEELLLKGLHQVVPGEFYCSATRPPAVYRGNPFQIEVGLAYGGVNAAQKVSLETLTDLLAESDCRTLRQFLMSTFDGLGAEAAERILKEAHFGARQSPAKLTRADIQKLHGAMQGVNLSEGQTMQVLRYANRVPLQFQQAGCAITQAVINTNWRAYGLTQPRGSLPHGPATVMVHVASVWVPFTSESKEAIAAYPEIERELRLGLQAVGRKLGMYLRRRYKLKQEGARRSIFLRYLGEVADAVSAINGADREELHQQLLKVAKRKTAEADVILDERGKPIEEDVEEFGDDVLIVQQAPEPPASAPQTKDRQGRLF